VKVDGDDGALFLMAGYPEKVDCDDMMEWVEIEGDSCMLGWYILTSYTTEKIENIAIVGKLREVVVAFIDSSCI